MKNILLLVITSALLSSCGGTHNLMGEKNTVMNENIQILDSIFHYNPNYQYHIKTDDKINISVWGQDELSVGSTYDVYNSNEVYGKYLMVDALGNIEVPKVGTLQVNDLEDYANVKYIKIFRQEGLNVRIATINLRAYGDYLGQNIQLIPSDIVVVPSKKYKKFDRRISVIIPFTSALTTAAIFKSTF
jgi:protein involved in polysaccharide export with SLBB domain